MNKKFEPLITYLSKKNDNTTAKELSDHLNISIRTVKKRVSEINYDHPQLILSSNKGYQLNRNISDKIISHNFPQDFEDRSSFFVKRLLCINGGSLNLFDLSDELYVSPSTIKNDIKKMNTSFSSFNVHFKILNNEVTIEGNESDKRRLISYVLNEEIKGNVMDISLLQENFRYYDLYELKNILNDYFMHHHITINDLTCHILIFHILILVERIRSGHSLPLSESTPLDQVYNTFNFSHLFTRLEIFFSVHFNSDDKKEILTLLFTYTDLKISTNKIEEKNLESDMITLANQIINKVNENFLINLNTPSFYSPFLLHLINLKKRLLLGTCLKNPLLENIKNSCPTIYDIASFIAYEIQNFFQKPILEDEIAYLALHVGTEIEKQGSDKNKIRCILYFPDYLKIYTSISNQLLDDFDDLIQIVEITHQKKDIYNNDFDILFSPVSFNDFPPSKIIIIPPFLNEYNKTFIRNSLIQAQIRIKAKLLKTQLSDYFQENLFYFNVDPATKENTLHIMSENLINCGYVDHDFEQEVLKRENMSSTGFMNIAIPHPLKMKATRTSISILVDQNGIQWDQNHVVKIVFMIAFNKFDTNHFHELYESLTALFLNNNVIDELMQCDTYEKFINCLIQNFIEKNT